MIHRILYIITLLITFQLTAQEKRWQLDSIQELDYDKEKVSVENHYLQQYDRKKKEITLVHRYRNEPETKYIYKYNSKDSLLQINEYDYRKNVIFLKDSILFAYSNDTIKKTHFHYSDKEGWKLYNQSKLIRIEGVYYWYDYEEEMTAYPYLSFDENKLEKYFLSPQEVKNKKGKVVERLFNLRNGRYHKYLYTYDAQGNITTIEFLVKERPKKMSPTGENPLPFEKEYKLEYEYYPHIPQKEVLDKWQKNKYNRYNDKAIKNIKVYRYSEYQKKYSYQHDLRFYYSKIK